MSAVEKAAQAVLDARAQFPGSTLADLYDPVTMQPALAKAHEALDRAVERCNRREPFPHDRARVEHLFALYEQLTAPSPPPRRRYGNGPREMLQSILSILSLKFKSVPQQFHE